MKNKDLKVTLLKGQKLNIDKTGDYYLPNIVLPKLRRTENMENQYKERIEQLVKQMAEKENATEELKANN